MQNDDLGDLTVFLTVAEERSFTRAGKRLGVSPSAISHAMRNLEEQIGVRLLSRTTRSVAPTPAGEQLLVRVRPASPTYAVHWSGSAGTRITPPGKCAFCCPSLP